MPTRSDGTIPLATSPGTDRILARPSTTSDHLAEAAKKVIVSQGTTRQPRITYAFRVRDSRVDRPGPARGAEAEQTE
jgi:hypothetical protein